MIHRFSFVAQVPKDVVLLPARGSRKLPLSKMQMAGIGPKMIRAVMKQRGVKSLEELTLHRPRADVTEKQTQGLNRHNHHCQRLLSGPAPVISSNPDHSVLQLTV